MAKLLHRFRQKRFALLDTGDGSHIELFGPSPTFPAVSDARATTEHVRRAGFEITVELKEVNLGGLEVTLAFFRGPSGEVIELFEPRP